MLSEGGALGWTSTPVVAGAVAFAVATPVFLLVQARRRYPLVDLRMFADRERSMAYLAAFLLSLARFAVVLLISLYLQAADGVDPFQAGLRVVPVAIGMMLASPIAGGLAHRYSARVLSTGGLALTRIGLAGLAAVLRPHLPYVTMALALLVIGAGSGLFLTPNTGSIMASIPARRRGGAAARHRQRHPVDDAEQRVRRERRAVAGDHHEPAGHARQEGRVRRDAVLASRAHAGRVHRRLPRRPAGARRDDDRRNGRVAAAQPASRRAGRRLRAGHVRHRGVAIDRHVGRRE
jgi:hypothetical protein